MESPHQPQEPLKLSLIVKTSLEYDRISARFRPHPSMGRPDRTGPVISLSVEPPDGCDRSQWRWNMHMASGRLSIIDVPDDFYAWSADERYRFLVQTIHSIGMDQTTGVHRYR